MCLGARCPRPTPGAAAAGLQLARRLRARPLVLPGSVALCVRPATSLRAGLEMKPSPGPLLRPCHDALARAPPAAGKSSGRRGSPCAPREWGQGPRQPPRRGPFMLCTNYIIWLWKLILEVGSDLILISPKPRFIFTFLKVVQINFVKQDKVCKISNVPGLPAKVSPFGSPTEEACFVRGTSLRLNEQVSQCAVPHAVRTFQNLLL